MCLCVCACVCEHTSIPLSASIPYPLEEEGELGDAISAVSLCRTQEGVKQSMQLKDAMRETCLLDLAEAWYNLLRAYQSADPELAAAVLSTVQRFVNWIDVSLVVNERSVNYLSPCCWGAESLSGCSRCWEWLSFVQCGAKSDLILEL